MVCKFCGRTVKCVSGKLWANVGGNICQASDNKKHELA
jgi:ribosomal protein L24E